MIKYSTKYVIIFLISMVTSIGSLWAQSQTSLDIALRYIDQNKTNWNLSDEDLADLAISDMYTDKHNGLTHIYFVQRHEGLEIYNALINLAVTKDGKAFNVSHSLIGDVASKINASSASITPEDAISVSASIMNIDLDKNHSFGKAEPIGEQIYRFKGNQISAQNIDVKLCYEADASGQLRLVWNLDLDKVGKMEYMNFRVDALTGKIFKQEDRIIKCSFESNPYHNHDVHCRDHDAMPALETPVAVEEGMNKLNTAIMDGTYRVYALPAESPSHGPLTLVTNPADPIASPYGWHDIDGVAGAEFTDTRGNNTISFRDRQSSQTPDSIDTDNDGNFDDIFVVDGGAALEFDFTPNLDGGLDDFDEAALVNLFYTVNMVHDISYQYGFTEEAGNFQTNNYGKGGIAGDPVRARAQADFDAGAINNATFGPTAEGSAPTMQMFLWDRSGGEQKLTKVTAPSEIAGTYATSHPDWGGAITVTDSVSGSVVIMNDGIPSPQVTDGCTEAMNADEIDGNIVMIDRGACEFGRKALFAEQAGAIAVIICNFEDDLIGMGAGAVGAQVTIPAVMMTAPDCALLRVHAGTSLEITLVEPPIFGPEYVDGDFDNGIIAHEYAHGISNRLTGGPSRTGCLSNTEQQGEGWSDFYSLIISAKAGDVGEMRRGIGTFALRQETDGRGIRPFPYSTDMNINPDTYGNISQRSIPHGVGSIWCQMIWDLYWKLSEEYGWSADRTDATAGNNIAIQLVMDGMKLQPCSPGFVTSRDAILRADTVNNNGVNGCLIWEVFARRGLGYLADQGSSDVVGDETESFEPLPTCIQEVKIAKTMTPTIEAGDEITVTVTITNHTEVTAEGIVVSDAIPEFTTFNAGSTTGGFAGTVNGDMVTFDLGDIPTLGEVTFSYTLSTPTDRYSVELFSDPAEDPNLWFARTIPNGDGSQPVNKWALTSDAFEGDMAWNVPDLGAEFIQHLVILDPVRIEGNTPVLRFTHKYDIEPGQDGGLFEISTDLNDPFDGVYSTVADDIFRGEYDGAVSYDAFAIPNLQTFWGNSGDWIESYIDLSAYRNQDTHFRFNYGGDDNATPATNYGGWTVDNIQLMDMKNYQSETCVTYTGGPSACAVAPGRGTIIQPQLGTPIREIDGTDVFVNVFPNPADDYITMTVSGNSNQRGLMSLMTIDGKEVMSQPVEVNSSTQSLRFDVKDVAAGFYFVKVTIGSGSVVEKVVIR